ncbi:MAG: hypothetical protein WDN04_06130 [Rhodospirillales bacterium]
MSDRWSTRTFGVWSAWRALYGCISGAVMAVVFHTLGQHSEPIVMMIGLSPIFVFWPREALKRTKGDLAVAKLLHGEAALRAALGHQPEATSETAL